eukprot:SAG31_NODE_409_length_16006_cov_10.345760_1_plen_81_part_00
MDLFLAPCCSSEAGDVPSALVPAAEGAAEGRTAPGPPIDSAALDGAEQLPEELRPLMAPLCRLLHERCVVSDCNLGHRIP